MYLCLLLSLSRCLSLSLSLRCLGGDPELWERPHDRVGDPNLTDEGGLPLSLSLCLGGVVGLSRRLGGLCGL